MREGHASRPGRRLDRPFLMLFLAACAGLLALMVGYAVVHAEHLRRGARLGHELRHTLMVNERLRETLDDQLRLLNRAMVQGGDPGGLERLGELQRHSSEQQNHYLRLDISPSERAAVERIKRMSFELALQGQYLLQSLARQDRERARAALERSLAVREAIGEQFERLTAARADALSAELEQARRAMLEPWVVGGALGLMLAFALAFMYVVRRRILRPLDELLSVAESVRHGDHSRRVRVGTGDELGRLGQEFNRMIDTVVENRDALEQAVDRRTAELREIQEQLVQSEKMSAVGRLVSGVAHELNNPLTAIAGFAELTRMQLDPEGDGKAAARLDAVLEQTERCRRIVGDLLQFARQRATRLEPVELAGVVRSALELQRFEKRAAGVSVEWTPPADPVVVLGDTLKLQQVLLVLLNNAADATAERPGERRVSIALDDAGDTVTLEVRDNGPGIAEPRRVFEPFYTTKPVGHGTGLGLSICYGIVDKHGGTISADNAPGGGAVFRIELPRSARSPAGTEPAGHPEPGATARRDAATVLVVDDEPALVELQVAWVRRMGLRALGAASGEEARRLLEREPVDAVVSDVRMPGIDGLALYDWVRRHRPELSERFLLTTGDLVGLQGEGRAGLPAPHLEKPFRFEAFNLALNRLLHEPERVA